MSLVKLRYVHSATQIRYMQLVMLILVLSVVSASQSAGYAEELRRPVVIRFKLNELLSAKAFREGRRIEWQEVAERAGIHRTTISRMLNTRGYNASMSNLDALCRYFECQVGDLAEYVPDAELEGSVQRSFRGPTTSTTRTAGQKVGKKAAATKKA
jgi:putative transcriptional regulator